MAEGLAEDADCLEGWLGFVPGEADLARHTTGDADFDLELFVGAYEGEDLVGHALAIRRAWKAGREKEGFLKWVFVRPGWRRHGHGARLLAACEEALRGQGCELVRYGNSAPFYLFPGMPTGDAGGRALLGSAGWTEVSERVSLVAELSALPFAPTDLDRGLARHPELHLVLAQPDDREPVLEFVSEDFSPSWAAEVAACFEDGSHGLCSILRSSGTGRPVGFAAIEAYNPNWFGPMGVREDLQGRGLGRLLVQHSALVARERGIPRFLVPWVGKNEPFYRKILGPGPRVAFRKCEKHL